jgi:hypothetical protein
VCVAAREGAKVWLRTLPGLVVCGGMSGGGLTSEVWRLDLGELRWERMPNLTRGRGAHACCAVRGGVAVLGGFAQGQEGRRQERTASVETLGCDSEAEQDGFMVRPPLSVGPISSSAAVAIDGSESDQGGQVLLLGGWKQNGIPSSAMHKVYKVDLAPGLCTPQLSLLAQQGVLAGRTAARLADGRNVCVGRNVNSPLLGTAQVLEPPPPELGSPVEASWQWRQ